MVSGLETAGPGKTPQESQVCFLTHSLNKHWPSILRNQMLSALLGKRRLPLSTRLTGLFTPRWLRTSKWKREKSTERNTEPPPASPSERPASLLSAFFREMRCSRIRAAHVGKDAEKRTDVSLGTVPVGPHGAERRLLAATRRSTFGERGCRDSYGGCVHRCMKNNIYISVVIVVIIIIFVLTPQELLKGEAVITRTVTARSFPGPFWLGEEEYQH